MRCPQPPTDRPRLGSRRTNATSLRTTLGVVVRRSCMTLGAVVLLSACGPSASSGTVTPGGPAGGGVRDGAAPNGDQEGDSVSELLDRLQRLEVRQEARMADAEADSKACHDLCSLSVSICEVQVKLCDIADNRPQEGTYQDFCREAQQECSEATASCESCVAGHEQNATMPAE